MKIKKILIISHHFWPENFLINEIALKLKKKFKVSIITGFPNYPKGEIYKKYKNNFSVKKENFNGIEIDVRTNSKNIITKWNFIKNINIIFQLIK